MKMEAFARFCIATKSVQYTHLVNGVGAMEIEAEERQARGTAMSFQSQP